MKYLSDKALCVRKVAAMVFKWIASHAPALIGSNEILLPLFEIIVQGI